MRSRRLTFGGLWVVSATLLCGGCGGSPKAAPPPIGAAADPQLNQFSDNAHTAYRLGNFELAARLYGSALSRAHATDDAPQIAGSAYNLAICEMALGRLDAARQHLRESKAESQRGNLPLGDVLLVESKVARLQNKPDEAAALAHAVIDSKEASTTAGQRAAANVTLGLIACDRKDTATASAQLNSVSQTNSDPALSVDIAELAASIAELQGNSEAAATAFDREAELALDCGQYARMVRALTQAGRNYCKLDRSAAAADRLFRAARSENGLGHAASAQQIAAEAAGFAERAQDEDLLGRITALRKQMQPAPAGR